MTGQEAHEILLNECLLALSERDCLVWKNTTGEGWVGRLKSHARGIVTIIGGRHIRFGLPGSTDIIGFLPTGRGLVVEVKTGVARLQKNQTDFRTAATRRNVLHIEARSVPQMLAELEPAL